MHAPREHAPHDNTPFWVAAKIVAIADGSQKYTERKRRKQVAIAKGMAKVQTVYGDGTVDEEWRNLAPGDFRRKKVGKGWQLDLDEVHDSDSDIIAEEEVDRLAAGYETAEHIDVHTVDDSSSESESSAD